MTCDKCGRSVRGAWLYLPFGWIGTSCKICLHYGAGVFDHSEFEDVSLNRNPRVTY